MLKKATIAAGVLAVAGGIAYAYQQSTAPLQQPIAQVQQHSVPASANSAAASSSSSSAVASSAKSASKDATPASAPAASPEVKAENKEDQFWVLPLAKWDKSDKKLSMEELSNKQSLEHADFAGKRVLMRVDYNVPIKKGVIKDTSRIDATLDTLKALLAVPAERKPKCVVLICHLGRPGGKFNREDFSLAPVAKVLEGYLKDIAPVKFLPECVGPMVEKEVNSASGGTVFMLENLRFHIEETGTGITAQGVKVKAKKLDVLRFRKALSALGDIFIFEAFGAAHRPHSSVSGIDIPQRVGGLLMARELNYFAKVLGKPKRPFLAIVGGAKVSDKIQVLEHMLDLVDELIIGGGMTYTFKKALQGVAIGKSIFDEKGATMVQRIMDKANERKVKVHFAVDHVIADKFDPEAQTAIKTDAEGIPDGWMALDIGPKSIKLFSSVIGRANTILWNGPLGVFEMPAFAKGTESAMFDMVAATQRGAITIIGGGDTGSASNKFSVNGKSVASQVSHVSTGGGSSLVLMEGNMLPGADRISDVRELPPKNIDLAALWQQVQALKSENYTLKEEVEVLRSMVYPHLAEADDDE